MLPILLLSLFGIVNLFLGFTKNKPLLTISAFVFTVVTFGVLVLDLELPVQFTSMVNTGMMNFDRFGVAFGAVILIGAGAMIALSESFLKDEKAQPAEYYALVLFSLVGALMMVSYENLIMLFVGLEILSISMYVLAGSDKRSLSSNEAALKYFLMGAFATGIFLYGLALVYGASGSFSLDGIADYVSGNAGNLSPLLKLGMFLMLVGMLFKLSVAPFHFWTPDVYEGTPTLFTALMSTVVKTAGIAALLKILGRGFIDVRDSWFLSLAVLACLTLVIANLTATYQKGFKRMMAWSSISHAGYLLIAVAAINQEAQEAILFYSLAYTLATIAGFGVLQAVDGKNGQTGYDTFNALAKREPVLAFVMTVSMLSLAGIPLTAGFFGKLLMIVSAYRAGGLEIVLFIAIVMSAVGIYYYFRVVIAMYMKKSRGEEPVIEVSGLYKAVLLMLTFGTLLLGIMPGLLADMF